MHGFNPRDPEKPGLKVTEAHRRNVEYDLRKTLFAIVSQESRIREFDDAYKHFHAQASKARQDAAVEAEERVTEDPYLVSADLSDTAQWIAAVRAKEEEMED